jgi:hypothetical protein
VFGTVVPAPVALWAVWMESPFWATTVKVYVVFALSFVAVAFVRLVIQTALVLEAPVESTQNPFQLVSAAVDVT